MIIIKNKNIY